jgi:hypothetical protein
MNDPDPAISELRNSWCRKYYPQKYNVPYMWAYGKEDKLLKRLIEWAREAFGDTFQERLAEGFRNFLLDQDVFMTKKKHLFSDFAANPQRWLGAPKKNTPIEAPQEPVHNPPWTDLELCNRIAEDPRAWVLGYKLMHDTLLRCCPTAYERLRKWIPEVIGKERANEIYKTNLVDNLGLGSMLKK